MTFDSAVVDVDEIATKIDHTEAGVTRGVFTGREAVAHIANLVSDVLSDSPTPLDQIELLCDYAAGATARIAVAPDVRDPSLVEWLDELLLGGQLRTTLATQLDVLLERLAADIRRREQHAVDDLIDLCRSGHQSHRVILSRGDAAEKVLRTAHRCRVPRALYVAACPAEDQGQIANANRAPDVHHLALDLLAHQAAEPDTPTGHEARQSLLHLSSFLEFAGEAAVRLPLHLLDDGQREYLLRVHEARTELLNDDPIRIPLGLDLVRDSRIIRQAVWQAFDASHL